MTSATPTLKARPEASVLLRISDAAVVAGVSERALRYYQELGLIVPSGSTPGGMRRYSRNDVARVVRIKELQSLLALNLDEIAVVLRNEDRLSEICIAYNQHGARSSHRRALLKECLTIQEVLRSTVCAKRDALDAFLVDLDERVKRIQDLLDGDTERAATGSAKESPKKSWGQPR